MSKNELETIINQAWEKKEEVNTGNFSDNHRF